MNRSLSLYLDAMRGTAAMVVFVGHMAWQQLSGGVLWMTIPLGHDAVMVFFVLSGFVIQHVTDTREPSARAYTVARLARLYSVIVPALALTLVCDTIGQALLPQLYPPQTWSEPWWRSLVVLSMNAQGWHSHVVAFSNDPFWSLPYVAWYYAMFGVWCFARGAWRWVWLTVCALWAGPVILLYLPVWLMGVLACRAVEWWPLTPGRAQAHVILSTMGLVAVAGCDMAGLLFRFHRDDLPHAFSPIDYALGLAVAVNIHAVAHLRWPAALPALPDVAADWIKRVAGWSFVLYLFHMPLLKLTRALLPEQTPPWLRACCMVLVVMGVVIPTVALTERHKRALHRVIDRWWGHWAQRTGADSR